MLRPAAVLAELGPDRSGVECANGSVRPTKAKGWTQEQRNFYASEELVALRLAVLGRKKLPSWVPDDRASFVPFAFKCFSSCRDPWCVGLCRPVPACAGSSDETQMLAFNALQCSSTT